MSNQSSPIQTVLLIAGVGFAALFVYSRLRATTPAAGTMPLISAPVTTSSATFPPTSAPTGFYWAPMSTGGYALQPLSNPYGITGIQQSAFSGLSNLFGGGLASLFGTPKASNSSGNLFSSLFGGSSSPAPSFSFPGVDSSLSFPSFTLTGNPPSSSDFSLGNYNPSNSFSSDAELTGPLPGVDTNPLSLISSSSPLPADSYGTTDAGLFDTPGAYAAASDPSGGYNFGNLELAATP